MDQNRVLRIKTHQSSLLRKCEMVSRIMKSLSHPVRLKVLCATIDQEQRVNDLAKFCNTTQSSMSQFLKRMKDEGLLKSRKIGTSVFYRISNDRLLRLLSAVREIYCS